MTLRDRLLPLANRVRRIPVALGERPTTVTVRKIVWSGGRVGAEGPKVTTDLVLDPIPRVRGMKANEIASSGGRYEVGDLKVGPITPAHPGGGYSQAELAPTAQGNGVQILYVISGMFDGEYDRVTLDDSASHSWWLILRRRRSTP